MKVNSRSEIGRFGLIVRVGGGQNVQIWEIVHVEETAQKFCFLGGAVRVAPSFRV